MRVKQTAVTKKATGHPKTMDAHPRIDAHPKTAAEQQFPGHPAAPQTDAN